VLPRATCAVGVWRVESEVEHEVKNEEELLREVVGFADESVWEMEKGFDLVWGSREGLRLDRRKAIAFNAQRVSKILALHSID